MPVTTGNLYIISPSPITVHTNHSYSTFTSPVNLFGILYALKIFHRLSLCTKCLLQVDKIKIHGCIPFINLFQYVTWDQICLTMSLPSLNPACSFLSLWSTLPCILLIRIFPRTLLVIGSSITPLQFPHCCRFPFFRILHIRPSFYFSCSFSSCQVRSKRCVSSMQVRSVSAFNRSAVIWSIPGAFPFLKVCITLLISSSVGGYVVVQFYF